MIAAPPYLFIVIVFDAVWSAGSQTTFQNAGLQGSGGHQSDSDPGLELWNRLHDGNANPAQSQSSDNPAQTLVGGIKQLFSGEYVSGG